jgi:hypothetical protein
MKKLLLVILLLASTTSFGEVALSSSERLGTFDGRVIAEWLDEGEGRKMKLIEPFAFVDQSGIRWDAPAGAIIDGASIPQIAWSLIGGPFEGRYRNASVIHDVACDNRKRSWKSVHRAFYEAMLASDVGITKAKIMYAAVYHFGPRWTVPIAKKKMAMKDISEYESSMKSQTKGAFDEKVKIMTRSIPRGLADCVPGIDCKSEAGVDLPPTHAEVTVNLTPIQSTLSEKDFERLRLSIESESLSLSQIEQFK